MWVHHPLSEAEKAASHISLTEALRGESMLYLGQVSNKEPKSQREENKGARGANSHLKGEGKGPQRKYCIPCGGGGNDSGSGLFCKFVWILIVNPFGSPCWLKSGFIQGYKVSSLHK